MVLPIPDQAAPEERAVLHSAQHKLRLAALGRFEPGHVLERAQLDDGVHRAVFLLLRAERAPDKLRQPPHVCRRVPAHLLVPEEEHPLGVRQVRAPVPEDVVPVRPGRRHAVAEVAGGGLDRDRLQPVLGPELVHEAPRRDQGVLGVAAHVHDPAPRRGDGPRQRRERDVRGEEPRVREPVEVRDPVARVELVLQVADAVVRAEGVERVAGAARGVLPPVDRGVEERLHPRGAGLGHGGDDDVRGARGEACVGDHRADHRRQGAVPALLMAVEQFRPGEAPGARPGGRQLGELPVELLVGFGIALLRRKGWGGGGGGHRTANSPS
ncbi:unnamed protein product [Triticum aestivum]|uniref:Uncharacterized protein n=1 Tax=Triticum aestivum TaxID=4565 RepID=A0A7H4LKJ5_WHEAT|nr:unnamed protein product [Triticum aestivum]